MLCHLQRLMHKDGSLPYLGQQQRSLHNCQRYVSLLIVRRDGQKVLLAVKNMGGESETAWRALLDDLVARGLKTPEFLIVDGAAGLEKALAALWPEVPTQRCTVHKHRQP